MRLDDAAHAIRGLEQGERHAAVFQFKRGDQPGDSTAHNGDMTHAPRW